MTAILIAAKEQRGNSGRTDDAFTIRDEDDGTILGAASVDGVPGAGSSTLRQISFAYQKLHLNSAKIALLCLRVDQPKQ
jgi:hypothetical protein